MFVVNRSAALPKADAYRELNAQLAALFADERDGLANAANLAALLFEALPDLNWAGFYFLRGASSCSGRFKARSRASA